MRFLVALAFAFSAAAQSVPVPAELSADGLPALPQDLAERLGRYNESRTAVLLDWEPGSGAALIATRFSEVPQIHRVATPGGARTQLTFFPDRVTQGSYEPVSGQFFVFSKDVGGGEFFQLYRYDLASGAVTLLTDGKSRNTSPQWSRDGKFIAFSSTRRNGTDSDVWIMDPRDPKTARLGFMLKGGGWAVSDWSPDSTQLVLQHYESVADSQLYLGDPARGTTQRLTPEGGGFYAEGSFSADAKNVWLRSDSGSDFTRLAILNLGTKGVDFISTEPNHDVESYELSRDGTRLAYTVNRDGYGVVHVLDTQSRKELSLPEIPSGVIGGLHWTAKGDRLGFSLSSARTPADVYSIDFANNTLKRWTESETGGLNANSFAQAELVKWPSFDGREISGFLYRPAASFPGKRPVIIDIHGGPEGQTRPGYLGRNNYYTSELGVALIYPNVRGSDGFGKTFVSLDNGVKREDSVKDIGALLDWIATRPDLDASRVMVMGGSYGGYMTLASMFHYNDRFRCAVDIVGISNFNTFLERTQSYRRDLRRVEYGDERDPKIKAFFEEIAPLKHASSIRKPMFIVAGRNDPRVPWQEGEQMTKAVRANGAPVWFLIGENEGHGFGHKRNQDFQFAATIRFVEEYLLK